MRRVQLARIVQHLLRFFSTLPDRTRLVRAQRSAKDYTRSSRRVIRGCRAPSGLHLQPQRLARVTTTTVRVRRLQPLRLLLEQQGRRNLSFPLPIRSDPRNLNNGGREGGTSDRMGRRAGPNIAARNPPWSDRGGSARRSERARPVRFTRLSVTSLSITRADRTDGSNRSRQTRETQSDGAIRRG